MAAFTDFDDLAVVMTGGGSAAPENVMAYKNGAATAGAAQITQGISVWNDWWGFDGIPGRGSLPGTVAAPTSATDGAIPFTNASGGRVKFIIQATTWANSNGAQLMIYDRLLHIGGLDYSVTTAQTVGGTITRNTGGEGNEIWFVVDTAISTQRNITASYTNQAGTASRTTPTYEVGNGGVFLPGTLYRLPLQAGDIGVQSVEDVTVAVAGTGTFGIVIARPLLMFGGTKRMTEPPWPKVDDNACLAMASPRMNQYGPFVASIGMAER